MLLGISPGRFEGKQMDTTHLNILLAGMVDPGRHTTSFEDYGWGAELANYGEYSGAPSTEARGGRREGCQVLRMARTYQAYL